MHALQIQHAVGAHGQLHVPHDVLDVATDELKVLGREGVAEDAADAQAGQDALEPVVGARDNQLAAAKKKGGAARGAQTDGDGSEALAAVERVGENSGESRQVDQGV